MTPSNKLILFLLLLCLPLCYGADKGRLFTVTAYCECEKCCGKNACGLFASGRPVYVGGVAADWRVLKKGTRITIQNCTGYFRVEDTGRLVKGNHIDIYMTNHSNALRFGVQKLRVKVLRSIKPP